MLEYSKLILQKVSFDPFLFEKELRKSISYLRPDEIEDLLNYLKVHHTEYSDILSAVHQLFFK